MADYGPTQSTNYYHQKDPEEVGHKDTIPSRRMNPETIDNCIYSKATGVISPLSPGPDEVGREDTVPIRWMAPETIESSIYSEATDVVRSP